MTTPGPTLEERVTILETRFDTILPTLATKEDIARLEGKMDSMSERLEGKMDSMNERLEGKIEGLDGKIDAMGNRLLIRLTGVMAALLAIAVAAARFL